jgi:hypothetical protein
MRFLRIRPLRLDLGDVLVQIVAVALGVICAFAVNSWETQHNQEVLQRATLRGIVIEIESNQSNLREASAHHVKTLHALLSLVQKTRGNKYVSITDLFTMLQTRSAFGVDAPLNIAWQIAQGDQGLSLLSYDTRYTLADLYQVQATFYEAEQRYGNSLLAIRQSPTDNYFVETLDLTSQATLVVAAETQLDALYTDALRKLR